MVRLAIGFVALAGATFLYACAGVLPPPSPPPRFTTASLPREIRLGAETAIQRVEPQVSREEIRAAVDRLLAGVRMCERWPGLWIEGAPRRSQYLVRFDLMTRDWGEAEAAASRARMQEFVDMGLLDKRERDDVGPGAVAFSLTEAGERAISGPSRSNLAFCVSPERVLGEITNLEWGDFECGSLRVSFTHVGHAWPSWARTEASQRKVVQTWAPVGQLMPGSVTLSRRWYQPTSVPAEVEQNGELRSLCFDQRRRRIIGSDLNLAAAPTVTDEGAQPGYPDDGTAGQASDLGQAVN